MRPERLEMAGFAPFRQPTPVDFEGLELFALTGPTGAGKSSVIDAITFALYGSVARYDKKSVGPIISLGAAEARVRFDFEVEGVSYTAVRVVRRTSRGGATTAEARLECGGDVLASGAAEVTSGVEALLGLGLDHFTRSVVLPQGEFAAFLHDTPAGQQDLVKALLDMGVLDGVRRLASERAKTARAVADQAGVRLDQLGDATEAAEKAAAARVETLERLVEPVQSAEEAIAAGESAARERAAEADRLAEQREQLASVRVPEGIAELSDTITSLKEHMAAAQEEATAAETALEKASAAAAELPTLATLEATADLQGRLAEAARRRDSLALDDLEQAVAEARQQVEGASERRRLAGEELELVRTRHAAHALTEGLSAGDPCPVCDHPLTADPPTALPDLDTSRRELEAAESAVAEAYERHRRAETALAEARATEQATREMISDLEERLEKLPPVSDLPTLKTNRRKADQAVEEGRDRVRAARQSQAALRERAEGLEESARRAWDSFAEGRDRLAALGPPPAERDDLARAWEELRGWAADRTTEVDEKLLQVRAAVDDANAAVEKQRDELERLLTEAEVGGVGTPSSRVAAAVATARAEQDRIRERCRERQALEEDRKKFQEEAQVAATLGNHLRADRFEGWLLSEALATLVEGANSLLADLTNGAYSLALDDRTIEVVDHRNADEHRSVRSLSGGETFLVSLALALSLGEQLTNLSDRGGARLEAIFLDEGFGSLDAETLETVTVVVTELAAQGRIVGVVTHVKELAEQIPVRFEVHTGPSGSTIEKVAV